MNIDHLIAGAGGVKELAAYLGVSYWRVAKWRQLQKIPEFAQLKYRAKLSRLARRSTTKDITP